MSPVRIQRQRTKGWRMPPNTVYVGRGSVWGNPFKVGEPCGVFPEGAGMQGKAETLIPSLSVQQSIQLYRDLLDGFISPEMYPFGHTWRHAFLLKFRNLHPADAIQSYLRGKNLACWCELSQPCHANVLLECANGAS